MSFTTAEDAISTSRKVQLEGASSPTDLLVGLDTTAPEACKTGLFAPARHHPAWALAID